VSHLLNVDGGLAEKAAMSLGLHKMPQRAEPAIPTRTDLEPSPSLSILLNSPTKFEGRKVGAVVTDGVNGWS
jgi:catalase